MVDRYSLVILLLCFVYNARSQDSNYCSISPSHTLCQFTVRILLPTCFQFTFFKIRKKPPHLIEQMLPQILQVHKSNFFL